MYGEWTEQSAELLSRYEDKLVLLFRQHGYEFRDSFYGDIQELKTTQLRRHRILKSRRALAQGHGDLILVLIVRDDGEVSHLITLQSGTAHNFTLPTERESVEVLNQIIEHEGFNSTSDCVWAEWGMIYLRSTLPFLTIYLGDSSDATVPDQIAKKYRFEPHVRRKGEGYEVVLSDVHPSRIVRWSLVFDKSGALASARHKDLLTASD